MPIHSPAEDPADSRTRRRPGFLALAGLLLALALAAAGGLGYVTLSNQPVPFGP